MPSSRRADSVAFVSAKAIVLAAYTALFVTKAPTRDLATPVVFVAVVVSLTAAALSLVFTQRFRCLPLGARIFGVLADFATLIVAFALGYFLLSGHAGEIPKLHTRIDALYFTTSVTTTVGFGDITADGQTARALAVFQMLFGFTYLAVIVAAVGASLTPSEKSGR